MNEVRLYSLSHRPSSWLHQHCSLCVKHDRPGTKEDSGGVVRGGITIRGQLHESMQNQQLHRLYTDSTPTPPMEGTASPAVYFQRNLTPWSPVRRLWPP